MRPLVDDAKAYLRQWYYDIAFWRHMRRWRQEHPTSLFTASLLLIAMLATLAVVLWFGLARVLANQAPWQLGDSETTEYSVLRMVLFILAGVVGVIGVVVAYRRQHSAEQARFLDRLAEASRLLGDPNPTVQAAGIYALAGLADGEGRVQRQQCVDVLCAYIRLPYSPSPKSQKPVALESVKRKVITNTSSGSVEEERVLFRPHDRHTRETIIRVIAQHLHKNAAVSWSDLNLDFTDAIFDYGDFTNAVFSGRDVRFVGTVFSDEAISFVGAVFSGNLNFRNAKFAGTAISFECAQFTGGSVDFTNAEFTVDYVDFRGTKFSGARVDFNRTTWSTVDFAGAKFSGGSVDFKYTECTHVADFGNARFSGGHVDFSYPRGFGIPHVPWPPGSEPPAGVLPRQWPPNTWSLN